MRIWSLEWQGTLNLISALVDDGDLGEFAKRAPVPGDAPSTSQVRVTVTITGLRGRRLRMDPQYSLPLQKSLRKPTLSPPRV